MLFKELKPGYPIHIFDRSTVEIKPGKVLNVSEPYIDRRMGAAPDMIVDVTIESEGSTKTFSFKDATSVGYVNSLIITADREPILREVEAIDSQAEQALALVDKNKATREKCGKILQEFNPALKEKQATEERFNKLETSMSEMMGMIKGLIKELKG